MANRVSAPRHATMYLVVSLLLWILTPFAFSAPVILNHSIRAQTNSLIFFNGDDFGSDPKVFFNVNGGAFQQATVVNKGYNTVTAKLTLSTGVFGAYVQTSAGNSNTVYLNRAIPLHMDMVEAVPGQTIRVFGRNLFISATPQIRLVHQPADPSKDRDLTIGSGANSLRLFGTVPTNTPLGNYDVYVYNGYGGFANHAVKLPNQLKVRAAATDYWNLGTGWAHDLNFYNNVYNVRTDPRMTLHADNVDSTNDLLAIQEAITRAKNDGGGVVFLPEGNYKIQTPSGRMLMLPSRVVLAGEGMDKTKILFGFGTPPTGTAYHAVGFQSGSKHSGLYNLAFINVNESGNWQSTLYSSSTAPASHLFLSKVLFDVNSGHYLEFTGNYSVVKDCEFIGHRGLVTSSVGMRFSNNVFNWTHGTALKLSSSVDAIVENNNFILAAFPGPETLPDPSVVRHSLVLSFVTNTWIGDNTFTSEELGTYNNDTEHIISEGGGADRKGEDYGFFGSSSGNTLTLDREFTNEELYEPNSVVCIVHGKGRGQWRPVTGRSGDVLTMGGSWQVPPDEDSRFSTFKWSARTTTIWRNNFSGTYRGIWLYASSFTDVAISSNVMTDMDGIYLRADQRHTRNQFSVLYNLQITDNNVSHASGNLPAMIGAVTSQVSNDTPFGTSVLNVEFRKNTVQGNNTTASSHYGVPGEGLFAMLKNEKSSPNYDYAAGIPAVLGTVFQWNTASNCKPGAIHLNTASFNTTLGSNTITNSVDNPPVILDDKKLNSSPMASTNTVVNP